MDSRFCDAVNERPRKKVRKINDRLRVFDYKTQSFVRDEARTSQTPWQMFTFVFFLFLRGESGEKHNKFQSWIFRKVSTDKIEARERESKWNVEKFAVVCFLWLHTKRIATAETNERGSASELWVRSRTKMNANAKEMEN